MEGSVQQKRAPRARYGAGTRTAAKSSVHIRSSYATQILWLLAIVLAVCCALSGGGATVHPSTGVAANLNGDHQSPAPAPSRGARTIGSVAKPAH
jgi:hypothetical protein